MTETKTLKAGGFRLVVVIGSKGVEVPAHPGNVTRDQARALKALYATHRPDAVTRVRKAL